MDKQTERSRPEEKGRGNDPQVRDESAVRPGVQTISEGANDQANEEVTYTAVEGRDNPKDPRADRRFDEAG